MRAFRRTFLYFLVFAFVTIFTSSPLLLSGGKSRHAIIPGEEADFSEFTCDPGIPIDDSERADLFSRLRESDIGSALIQDFIAKYGSLKRLLIQWNSVSYSQLSPREDRSPASGNSNSVCIHLTRRLPDIEHVADLAHELVHATRLEEAVLRGEVQDASEFVSSRIKSRGGEAEAFAVECQVKFEINEKWDELCVPYSISENSNRINLTKIVHDLYSGQLSASLTGEAYPKMLAKQYRLMQAQKKRRSISSSK